MFEATQYDSYGYLFTNPKFISLDADARRRATSRSRACASASTAPSRTSARRIACWTRRSRDAQLLGRDRPARCRRSARSSGSRKGPTSDEFFLCFDQLGSRRTCARRSPPAVPQPPVDLATRPPTSACARSMQINATMATITGVSPNTTQVKATYDERAAVAAGDAGHPGVPVVASDFDRAAGDLQYCSAHGGRHRRAHAPSSAR